MANFEDSTCSRYLPFQRKSTKNTAYIIEEGKRLIVPNTLAITRSRDEEIEDILDSDHYKNVGVKMIEH